MLKSHALGLMPKKGFMQRQCRNKVSEPKLIYDTTAVSLPPFTSTPEEIYRAVERNAVERGVLLIKVLVSLDLDGLLRTVEQLVVENDREEVYEDAAKLGIDPTALAILDNAHPPLPYPYYFCAPAYLLRYPRLVMYYRNVAMLSSKVMRGIGLNTQAYEINLATPSEALATELTVHFNRIVSALIKIAGVTPHRHLEMMYANLGDSLGDVSRNEVDRQASAQVIKMLALHLHQKWHLASVVYKLKGSVLPEEDEEPAETGVEQEMVVTQDMDLESEIARLESQRVKYRELRLRNGNRLLLDRQFDWATSEGQSYRIGPDLISRSPAVDMLWAGEIKGGADPAGSDEHWKTATQALGRILEAAEKTGRPKPELSFIATVIVERVAWEAQLWIAQGKLTSVYNLTKIAESPLERQGFLDEMTTFLGCL